MHFCRVTHVLYLCHNTYFWGAWMIKSFFFSSFFFRSRDKSLWCPEVHWRVQAQIRDGESEMKSVLFLEFSTTDTELNCFLKLIISIIVGELCELLVLSNDSSEVCHCLLRFQLWSRCTPMKKTLTALSTFSNKLLSTISLNRFVSI